MRLTRRAAPACVRVRSFLVKRLRGNKQITAARKRSLALPAGWTKMIDPATQVAYYANSLTGQVQWEPPPGATEPAAEMQPAGAGGLPAGWTEATDPTSGTKYYINEKTKTSSWERPTMPA